MLKINAHTRLKVTAGGDSGFPRPDIHSNNTGVEDTTGHDLFAAPEDENVIAPAMSYKEENEKQLEKTQDEVNKGLKESMARVTARLKVTGGQ